MKKVSNYSVAFVLSSLKFGGGERVALNLAHAFKDRGLQVSILLMSYEGEFLNEACSHFNVVDLCCDRTWKLPVKLAAYLRREQPDALISSFWKLNLSACLARMLYPKVRLLLWEHAPPSTIKDSPLWLYSLSATLLYPACTKIIAVSTEVYNNIAHVTVGLRSKLQVIFNPIPVSPKTDISIRANGSSHRIIWVGRMDDGKNPYLMLEAFARLPKEQEYFLDFVGDGPVRLSLENRTRVLGLQSRVRFLGFQTNPYAWMAESDLLVLTSEYEGLPSVLIEALHCGISVISTNCGGGIHDILLDNQYGTIIPKGNSSILSEAIVDILKKPYEPEKQRDGGRRFLPSLIAEQFLEVLGFSCPNMSKID